MILVISIFGVILSVAEGLPQRRKDAEIKVAKWYVAQECDARMIP